MAGGGHVFCNASKNEFRGWVTTGLESVNFLRCIFVGPNLAGFLSYWLHYLQL